MNAKLLFSTRHMKLPGIIYWACSLSLQSLCPALHIHDEWVALPDRHGRLKRLRTVSRKEILLALLQHGRLTEFSGTACDIAALREHVELRQNTVAWAEKLTWMWPDGDAAQWNEKYWRAGTPRPGVPLHQALNDVFVHQDKYAIGCCTATTTTTTPTPTSRN